MAPADDARISNDKGRTPSNLTLRILSAAVMAPVAIAAAWWGGWIFALFWTAAALAVLWEWTGLAVDNVKPPVLLSSALCIVAVTVLAVLDKPALACLLLLAGALLGAIAVPGTQRRWVAGGIVYAGVMALAPVTLRGDGWLGFIAIALLFAVVWTTDVLAYFTGRAIGGPKLLPSVSPKKTWSGAIGGAIGAVVAAVLLGSMAGGFNIAALAIVAFALSVVSQAGDLLESQIKRRFNAKDASHLIPGHGGVMDRLDGFWAAVIVAVAVGLWRGGLDNPAGGLLLW